MRTKTAIAIGLLPIIAAAAWWWLADVATQHGDEVGALRPDDGKVTARGAVIYRQQCASCHGEALEGQPNWRTRGADGLLPAPPHDASGHTWHHPDELLIRITRDGVAAVVGDPGYKTSMPVYRDVLSDQEIVAVLSWIKSQWPPEVRKRHDQVNASKR
ncbi:cytochrome c [uncultured Piscinibacter sp.]|uniref:c-type cytochrome n=1 Tax=uncultured Piscinibacter sp. TaxID=1131835 RepID=UPI002617FA65|nr:cytochrome c [uncultured Piscinibacter sp.]